MYRITRSLVAGIYPSIPVEKVSHITKQMITNDFSKIKSLAVEDRLTADKSWTFDPEPDERKEDSDSLIPPLPQAWRGFSKYYV